MTRAPILSAAAAALLLSLAAMGPLAAEDAATPAAPAMTPAPSAAPAKGEFDNSCAMGLADGQMVKTDCSINWTAPDGKVYCFSSDNIEGDLPQERRSQHQESEDFADLAKKSRCAAAASRAALPPPDPPRTSPRTTSTLR